MLFSLGLGLRWDADALGRMPALIPVLLIQLVLTPLAVWGFAGLLGLQGGMLTGVVLEAAMPAMVLGIVLCDRFGLDTALYAMAVTLSTALSMLTLPLWFSLLGGGAV
jgi:predicted permease